MKCKECRSCYKGYFASKPNAYVCIGVKEPFVINDINVECTEYPEKRNNITIEDAIAHFKHGISHDIFSEPVTTYAKMAVEALEKQISKKPIGNLHSVPHYRCPICKNAVVLYERDNKPSRCEWCGQLLLWE